MQSTIIAEYDKCTIITIFLLRGPVQEAQQVSVTEKLSNERKMIRTFNKTLHEYASSSSAHGVAYIFEPGRLGLERLLWIFVVGFAMIFR